MWLYCYMGISYLLINLKGTFINVKHSEKQYLHYWLLQVGLHTVVWKFSFSASWASQANEAKCTVALSEAHEFRFKKWSICLVSWMLYLLEVHFRKQMGWKCSGSKERWKTLLNLSNIPMMKQKQRATPSFPEYAAWFHFQLITRAVIQWCFH